MTGFLDWFNSEPEVDPVLQGGIARLCFVTIHPFDDGNGRITREIADLFLARSEKSSRRFYSMSAQIRQERNAYYDLLEQRQKSATEITDWLTWLLECLRRTVKGAETLLASVLTMARFWGDYRRVALE